MKITTRERFERKVIRDSSSSCHLWIGSTNKDSGGHGRFRIGGKVLCAHRVAYELYCGEIPVNMQVLHKCDVPNCVNPEHLFLGSQMENIADMHRKNRAVCLKGSLHGMAKLSDEKAMEIRWLHAFGESSRKLAETYQVTRRAIMNVYQNKFWQQVVHD